MFAVMFIICSINLRFIYQVMSLMEQKPQSWNFYGLGALITTVYLYTLSKVFTIQQRDGACLMRNKQALLHTSTIINLLCVMYVKCFLTLASKYIAS